MSRYLFSFLLFSMTLNASTGKEAMVVTAHPVATEAAVEVMRQGGNAVDAAITASFVLAVVEPYSSGIGGGGFFVVYDAENNNAEALDAREMAPAKSSRDMYLNDGEIIPRMSIDGSFSVAIPGLVRGLSELHIKNGSLPWDELIEPAIEVAAKGFLVDELLISRIEYNRDRFNDAAKDIFIPDGTIPSILIQRDLSETLKQIADNPDHFYVGEIADKIVKTVEHITSEDFKSYKPKWRNPVSGNYRGYEIWSMPPPSSGGVHIVQMLNILEPYDLQSMGHNSSLSVHLLAESMKFAYADRSKWLGDPDFFDVPVEMLVSKKYASKQQGLIAENKIFPAIDAGGIKSNDIEGNDTTHFSIIDKDGNSVAATLTINLSFGSGMIAHGTGVILNNEMDDFSSKPGAPNAFGLVGSEANCIEPGKRPLSSMTPTIVTEKGEVRLVTGSPGGSRIITSTLQTVINIIDYKMTPKQAVDAGRIHYQWSPDILWVEPLALTGETSQQLKSIGHKMQIRQSMGNVQLIYIDPVSGIITGASDCRGVGKASGF